jgi:proteasome lid subunit RPN8/RPN11
MTAMDDDIHFGDLAHVPHDQRMRPDQNHHFAVVACGAPGAQDLPIYVDLDVMREMEAHALSDPSVELGGVLLGGQFEDADGHPFVVISDSLRAEHYESTKGSFKFTHETWSAISRRRDEFPDETRMVGWYHTHPGWGVFLSGMDTFICEHFFNKPLDVALVIDPCQRERGFFQWTTAGERRTRSTNGFYLTASRLRREELDLFAAQLEGKIAMPTDPRLSGLPGAYPPMVVQLSEPRQPWMPVAVFGMLTMQLLVVALIAWRVLAPAESPNATAAPPDRELVAQRQLLDAVIGELHVAPEGVVQSLEESRRKNEELTSANVGLLAQVRELAAEQKQTETQLKSALKRGTELDTRLERIKEDQTASREEIVALKDKLAEYEEAPQEDPKTGWTDWRKHWKWYVSGAVVLCLALVAGWFAWRGPLPYSTDEDPPADETPSST